MFHPQVGDLATMVWSDDEDENYSVEVVGRNDADNYMEVKIVDEDVIIPVEYLDGQYHAQDDVVVFTKVGA